MRYDSLNQGRLGDCWFLSALVSLGNKNLELVKGLVVNGGGLNASRIYGINFYELGVLTTIVIDDYLPFMSATGANPAFANVSDNKGLWTMLIEKAYSKLYGSFKSIEGG